MLLAPRARSTLADLLRVLALWLAAILLVQGLAAAQALGSGPLHRHRDAVASAQPAHHHDAEERHHHDRHDVTALPVEADAALDSASFALTAALALMALAFSRVTPAACAQVQRAARAWAWCAFTPAPLRKPPRLG
ncbi:MAG: hypothetical protein V4792_01940 [Pseudomonadota bacterium]